MTEPRVTLRYFQCAGRAQPLRLALADAGIAFEDLRVAMDEWPAHKLTPAFAGPHACLPTLTWNDATVAETLPIASFLAKRLGQYEGLDDEAIALREAVSSTCYIEILTRVAEVVYADGLHPGVDLPKSFALIGSHMMTKLDRVEANASGDFLFGDEPCVPDFFAYEALFHLRRTRAPADHAAFAARYPRLHALEARLDARPRFAAEKAKRPTGFTVHPNEEGILASVHAVPLTGV